MPTACLLSTPPLGTVFWRAGALRPAGANSRLRWEALAPRPVAKDRTSYVRPPETLLSTAQKHPIDQIVDAFTASGCGPVIDRSARSQPPRLSVLMAGDPPSMAGGQPDQPSKQLGLSLIEAASAVPDGDAPAASDSLLEPNQERTWYPCPPLVSVGRIACSLPVVKCLVILCGDEPR